jgi:uroporphyrinogen-III synthase
VTRIALIRPLATSWAMRSVTGTPTVRYATTLRTIGPRTAKDARKAGLGVSAVAREQTIEGLIAAVSRFPLPHAADEFAV